MAWPNWYWGNVNLNSVVAAIGIWPQAFDDSTNQDQEKRKKVPEEVVGAMFGLPTLTPVNLGGAGVGETKVNGHKDLTYYY